MSSNMTGLPGISVVISTRGRCEKLAGAVESVLGCDYPNFELWVIDQNEDDQGRRALQPFRADRRFHYLSSATLGCSAGRNLGIEAAAYEIVAITDDDCTFPANWLRELAAAFSGDPRIGAVCGNVLAGPHDREAGFIPTYERKRPVLACGLRDKNRVRGISACLGLRKSAWRAAGRFDEMLGAGGPFRAAADADFIIKILKAGYHVYDRPAWVAWHHGFRTWREGRRLARRNYFGIGAYLSKHFRLNPFTALPLLAYEGSQVLYHQCLVNSLRRRRPAGLTPLLAFGQGFLVGLVAPLDRPDGNFRPLPVAQLLYKARPLQQQ